MLAVKIKGDRLPEDQGSVGRHLVKRNSLVTRIVMMDAVGRAPATLLS
jgi:hypothetical protein